MRLSVVVCTRNRATLLGSCLAAFDAVREPDVDLEVIVVDNGSCDGTAAAVAERHREVRVLRQEQNLGFAEGNNVGIRHALASGADHVLLLNNDTTIAPDVVTRCVETALRHSDAGAVCPVIHFAEPAHLIWYAGAVFDPRRARSGRMLGYRERDEGQFDAATVTDRAVGAAMLVPRSVLERVGLLDADLFFLYEDVDWSLRARRAGHRIYLAPAARVWHRVSATAGGEHSATIAYYDTRNHLTVCRRHAPLSGLASLRRELAILLVHLAGARRSRRRLAYLAAVLRGWRDGRRGHLGPAPQSRASGS